MSNNGSGMAITTVAYRRLRSFGSYENECIGATGVVGEDGPEAALEQLKGWVDEQLNQVILSHEDRRMLRSQIREAREELHEIEGSIEGAKLRFERAKEFLAKHGVSVDFEEDMPF